MSRRWMSRLLASRRWVASVFTVLLAVAGMAAGAQAKARGDAALLIDDFEDGDLLTPSGSAWIPLGDDLFGGKSTLRLEAVRGGAHGSRGELRLTGTIAEGPNSVAGAWSSVVDGGRAADVSRFEGLRLRLRGDGDVLVGIRSGPVADSVNFMARVKASRDWEAITIPFTELRPQGKGKEGAAWNPHQARWLGVSSVPGAVGPFRVEIDDLSWTSASGSAAAPAALPAEPPLSRSLTADDPAPLKGLPWRDLANDTEGDGRPGLPDARALFVARDPARPLVWFRIDLQDPPPANWIGVNIALDTDGDPANGTAWWGKNTSFHFDRLVSAWVWKISDRRWDGSVGIVSAQEAAAFQATNEKDVHLAVDRGLKRVYVGVPAAVTEAPATRLIAAVGSAMVFGDDLPNEGSVTLAKPGSVLE